MDNIPDQNQATFYDFTVTILPDEHRLEATGTLQLPASDTNRNRIRILLSESMPAFHVEVIAPLSSRGQPLLERHDRPGNSPGWGHTIWTISPRSPFPAGQPILLRFSCAGGSQPGFIFYLGPEGSFASGINTPWYPQVLNSLDHPSTALGRLDFRVPAGYTVIATGSAQVESPGLGEYRFVTTWPGYFAFAAGQYKVLRSEGMVSMALYLLRPHDHAESYLAGCAKILETLVREYGPYPYGNQYAIVEAQSEKMGGSSGASMENFMLANNTSLDAPFNPVFYGHEIGHTWWGNLIKQQGERGRLMLDEGMAQYSALVALEALEGSHAAQQLRRHGDPASPVEHSSTTYFSLTAAGLDHPLSQLPAEWNSRNLASSKGPLVMDLLAQTISRDRFREILRGITQRHAFHNITWDQFVDAFDGGTDGQYRWFFSQWFDQAGAPDWKLHWEQEGGTLHGVITQVPPLYRAAVDIEMTDTNGCRIVRSFEIQSQAQTDFTWNIDAQVRSVVLDPNFQVPHWTPQVRAEAQLLAPYWQAFVMEESNQHDAALAYLKANVKQIPAEDPVGARFMLEELTARLLAGDPQTLLEARTHLEQGLMSASRRTERLGWAYFLLAYIAAGLGDQTTLLLAIEGAVSADALVGSWSGWGIASRAFL